MANITTMHTEGGALALLRLLQLASPTLPVGAYAYSQGLEWAVEETLVKDETSAENWILGILRHNQSYLDVPVLARLYRAWTEDDQAAVVRWTDTLFAARETAELQHEDQHLGTALARLLSELDVILATRWRTAPRVCFATLFSLAAVHWHIALRETVMAYLWSWTENQVAAATKLVPLGQTAGQRILSRTMPAIVQVATRGLALADDEIGCSLPGMALASALHETQYSRLFRS